MHSTDKLLLTYCGIGVVVPFGVRAPAALLCRDLAGSALRGAGATLMVGAILALPLLLAALLSRRALHPLGLERRWSRLVIALVVLLLGGCLMAWLGTRYPRSLWIVVAAVIGAVLLSCITAFILNPPYGERWRKLGPRSATGSLSMLGVPLVLGGFTHGYEIGLLCINPAARPALSILYLLFAPIGMLVAYALGFAFSGVIESHLAPRSQL